MHDRTSMVGARRKCNSLAHTTRGASDRLTSLHASEGTGAYSWATTPSMRTSTATRRGWRLGSSSNTSGLSRDLLFAHVPSLSYRVAHLTCSPDCRKNPRQLPLIKHFPISKNQEGLTNGPFRYINPNFPDALCFDFHRVDPRDKAHRGH